ncbi:MAG TPA: PAS domain-containing protein [Candidatus Limnocylindrales bacterium]|nr:PAS domain-containing protein [Candidatus Limnocylindrales bacterium]
MAHKDIELILVRQLASRLAVPVFVVDTEGDLLYFNEPAEQLLGRRFDEVDEMPFVTWTTAFLPRDEQGREMPVESIPLVAAIRRRRPVHGNLRIVGLDGIGRTIEVTAFPLEGSGGRQLGAVAMFWESDGVAGRAS